MESTLFKILQSTCVSIHYWKKSDQLFFSDQHSKIYCLRYSIGSWHTNSKDFFKLSAIQRNGTQSNKDMKCDAWDFQIGNWPSQNEHGILWSSSFFLWKISECWTTPSSIYRHNELEFFQINFTDFFFKAAFSKFWFIFPPYI